MEALLAQRDLAPRQRERLEMVKAAWLGAGRGHDRALERAHAAHGAPLAARRSGTGGMAALAGAPIPGRPPKADAAYLAALEQAVETPPRDAGLAVRCLDLGAAERLPRGADRDAHRPGLAAGAAAPAALRLRPRPNTPSTICKTRPKSPPARQPCGRRGKKVAAAAGAVRVAL